MKEKGQELFSFLLRTPRIERNHLQYPDLEIMKITYIVMNDKVFFPEKLQVKTSIIFKN